MIPRLPSWPATLEALALVVNPRLELRQLNLHLGIFLFLFLCLKKIVVVGVE